MFETKKKIDYLQFASSFRSVSCCAKKQHRPKSFARMSEINFGDYITDAKRHLMNTRFLISFTIFGNRNQH